MKVQRDPGSRPSERLPIRNVRNVIVSADDGSVLCNLNDQSGQEDSVLVDCYLTAGDPPRTLIRCPVLLSKNAVSVWCE